MSLCGVRTVFGLVLEGDLVAVELLLQLGDGIVHVGAVVDGRFAEGHVALIAHGDLPAGSRTQHAQREYADGRRNLHKPDTVHGEPSPIEALDVSGSRRRTKQKSPGSVSLPGLDVAPTKMMTVLSGQTCETSAHTARPRPGTYPAQQLARMSRRRMDCLYQTAGNAVNET